MSKTKKLKTPKKKFISPSIKVNPCSEIALPDPLTKKQQKRLDQLISEREDKTYNNKRQMFKDMPRSVREYIQTHMLAYELLTEINGYQASKTQEEIDLDNKNRLVLDARNLHGFLGQPRFDTMYMRNFIPPLPDLDGFDEEEIKRLLNDAALEEELLYTESNDT